MTAPRTHNTSGESRADLRPFIPAWLDDSGLTPHQFRILCHIARRGICYESLRKSAACCRMKRQTAQDAVAELLKKGLLIKTSRVGQTSIYELPPDPKGVLGSNKGTRPEKGTTPRPERGTRDLTRKGYYKGSPNKVPLLNGGSPPEMWRLIRDKKQLTELLQTEAAKTKPDAELISSLRVELKDTNEAIKQHGRNRKAQGAVEEPASEANPGRNAGTFNSGCTGKYGGNKFDEPPANVRNVCHGRQSEAQARELATTADPEPAPVQAVDFEALKRDLRASEEWKPERRKRV